MIEERRVRTRPETDPIMNEQLIKDALRDATDTADVVIGEGVLQSVADVFEDSFGDCPAVVVADENTFRVAGGAVQGRLQAAGRDLIEPFVFPASPPSTPTTRTSRRWSPRFAPTARYLWRSGRARSTTSSSGPHTNAAAPT
jgi:hypothetical protein